MHLFVVLIDLIFVPPSSTFRVVKYYRILESKEECFFCERIADCVDQVINFRGGCQSPSAFPLAGEVRWEGRYAGKVATGCKLARHCKRANKHKVLYMKAGSAIFCLHALHPRFSCDAIQSFSCACREVECILRSCPLDVTPRASHLVRKLMDDARSSRPSFPPLS